MSEATPSAEESEFWHTEAIMGAAEAIKGTKIGPVDAQSQLDAVDAEHLARKVLAQIQPAVEEVVDRSDRLARKLAQGPMAAQLSQTHLQASGMTTFANHLRGVHTMAALMTADRLKRAEAALSEADVPLDLLRAYHLHQAAEQADELAAAIKAPPATPGTDD